MLSEFTNYKYRVLVTEEKGRKLLGIHRVYYDHEDKPSTYGKEAAQLYDINESDLRVEYVRMAAAFNYPILYGDYRFPKEYKQ